MERNGDRRRLSKLDFFPHNSVRVGDHNYFIWLPECHTKTLTHMTYFRISMTCCRMISNQCAYIFLHSMIYIYNYIYVCVHIYATLFDRH